MILPAPIDLTAFFVERIQQFLVLTPTSNSPQPVHVLNGFFNNSLTGRRASKTAVDLIATKQGGEWAVGHRQLREKSALRLPQDDHKLEKARRAVSALIGADRAVFTGGFASFQLAHLGLITSDSTHFKIGELASRLVLRGTEGRALVEELIRRLSTPQPNPHWALEAVLSDPGILDDLSVADPDPSAWWADEESCTEFADELTHLLSRSLALCVKATDSLLGLEILAVTATWVGLLVYSQVPSLCLGVGFVPLLTQASEPGFLNSVRASSGAVVERLDGTFGRWIASRLREEVEARFHSGYPEPEDAVEYVVASKPKKKLSGGSELSREQIDEIYRAWVHDHSPSEALSFTLRDSLVAAHGNKSRDWFAAVGRHCGFVGPRRGLFPRLRAEVTLAPSLVMAGISEEDGESIPFEVWARRLADRFGILFGPNEISSGMSPRASEVELHDNQSELTTLLVSLGLARRFSDGITEILNPFDLWGQA